MRWVLLGLCFAVLVGLAIATVALKSGNVATRARLETLERGIVAHSVENVRRRDAVRRATARDELVRRLQLLERQRSAP